MTLTILYNARIHTLDPIKPSASALAIDHGRILLAGTDDEVRREFINRGTHEDMLGAVILPGLVDAHVHFRQYALGLQKIDCETSSLAECLARVKERIEQTPPGTWVLGHGWNQNEWNDCTGGLGGFPNAAMLDELSAQHPIYLTAKSMHAGWANSTALNAAGLSASTPDPGNGSFQRDEAGELTGIMFEGTMSLVSQAVPQASQAEINQAMLDAQSILWKMGLTGLHDFDRRKSFIALQTVHREGRLKLRINKNLPVERLDHIIETGLQGGFGDDMLRIGRIKAFADGALGPHTAAMFDPYDDEPGNRGMLLLDGEEIFEFGRKAALNGLGLTIHAIGDRANHEVLNAFENLRRFEKANNLPAYRHRLEHVQVLHPDDFPRLAAMDIIASMQPIHAASDMFAADRYWGSRAQYSYAWKKLLDLGTRMAFGSDAPVESPNPFWGLHAAITRTRPGNIPSPDGWYPEQKVSRQHALEAYTTGPAYAAGMEDRLGRLAPGFLADLITLDTDPLACEANAIRDIMPTATMVAGEWVYRT